MTRLLAAFAVATLVSGCMGSDPASRSGGAPALKGPVLENPFPGLIAQ